jgi:alpha-galactosidase
MGWNTWNHFGCNIDEALIRDMADAMVNSGMRDAGYEYVIIDDCWQIARGADGEIVADPGRFPSGIETLADYVHERGLKLGIYTDAGLYTCQGRPGSYGHEQQDANTYAAWGVDYVKVDWCYAEELGPRSPYALWRDILCAVDRPMVFSICNWGLDAPWSWGPGTGHLWRTTYDIEDRWGSILEIADFNVHLAAYAGPGGWNDPDMLEVGNGGMTNAEYRAHMSLWAIMAAPLIAGNDLQTMSPATRDLLTNQEVIAVDQDRAGIQGTRVHDAGLREVWVKPLAEAGTRAVVLLNRALVAADIAVSWQ